MNVFIYSVHWHHFQLFPWYKHVCPLTNCPGRADLFYFFIVVEQNFWLVLHSLECKINNLILLGTRLILQSK